MSQPPLSRAISNLELYLGAKLFERNRRSVALTRAGAQFLTDVRHVLAEMERAVENLRLAERGLRGKIDIGYFGSLIYSFVPWILSAFQECYPEIEPRLHNLSKDRQIAAILDRRIDIGFARQYPSQAGLVSEALVDERLVLATPRTGRLARKSKLVLADLHNEPLVLFPRVPRPSFADSVIGLVSAAGAVPLVVAEMDDAAGCLAMVSAGRGSAIMPASMRMLQGGGVHFKPFTPVEPTSPIACIYAAGTRPLFLQNFLDVARRRAARYGHNIPPT